MQFTIITGMSGAGKSAAVKALEDMGVYCVDNMPPSLVVRFAQLCLQVKSMDKVAVVVDARGKEMFPQLFGALELLDQEKIPYQILFLDASVEELINRYKITRRRHPLLGDDCDSLNKAILAEKTMLSGAKSQADYVVDTTLLTMNQLKARIQELLCGKETGFLVNCISFGFKYGVPTDADLMFDVRCLPNPFYEASLREKTGLDREVQDFVLSSEKTSGFLEKLYDFLDYMLPLYSNDESKCQLVIAVGCTGGKHRSVTITRELQHHFIGKGFRVITSHRDIEKRKY